jgi:hypothetical protein
MNTNVESSARPASTAAAASLDRLRQGNFAVLVLLVVECARGTGATEPAAGVGRTGPRPPRRA